MTTSNSALAHTRVLARLAVLGLGGFAAVWSAEAQWTNQEVWVQSYGVDAPGCGTRAVPCRSITRALAAAQPGATIRVGPGRYGDVNRNGQYDPGDEGPPSAGSAERRPSMLRIAKSVRILSTHGAEVTTIEVGPPASPGSYVRTVGIVANDVRFGSAGYGFRVAAGLLWADGGVVLDRAVPIRNVAIAGNIVERVPGLEGSAGIDVNGPHETVLVTDNDVSGFGIGLVLEITRDDARVPAGGPVTAARNTLHDNLAGFVAYGRKITVAQNIVARNSGGSGVDDDPRSLTSSDPPVLDPVIENSYLVDNEGVAAIVAAGGGAFVGNVIVANREAGILHFAGTIGRLERNNIFGNGLVPAFGIYPSGEPNFPENCGIIVDWYRAEGADPAVAVNNYWGAPSGPGPNPADDSSAAGSPCHPSPGGVTDTPFATAPFDVPRPATRAAPRG